MHATPIWDKLFDVDFSGTKGLPLDYDKISKLYSKVSKSQKYFFLKVHYPKSDLNFRQISALRPFLLKCD